MARYEAIARYNREPRLLGSLSDHTSEESSNPSPNSARTANFPTTALAPNVLIKQEGADLDDDKPSFGPQGQNSSCEKSDKEKRKRSRVTPEQLIHLERYFAMDRSPTASRRRDISDLLGMQERQTQIWFQNRRAKAKLQDGKYSSRGDSMEAPLQTPPESPPIFEVDLHNLIHEDEPVTLIPCTDLTVGTWRRIATTAKHDLVAYTSESKRCLTWFIHSGGCGFKMEIPFDTVIDTQYDNAASGSALAVFVLSRPPIFYLENTSSPRSDGSVARTWKRCSDWTEGHQATQVLRHTLVGSAAQLARVLRNLHASTDVSDMPLRSLSYRPESLASSPMEIPPPPLANLNNGSVFPYAGSEMKNPQVNRIEQSIKRPFYSSPETGYAFDRDLRPPPHTAPAATFAQHTYLPSRHNRRSSSNCEPTAFQNYHSHQGPPNSGYFVAPVPLSVASVSYPPQTQYYNNSPRALQVEFQSEVHHSPNQPQPFNTPPFLAAPCHPSTNIDRRSNNIQTPSPASSMPGIVYEVNEDLRGQRSG